MNTLRDPIPYAHRHASGMCCPLSVTTVRAGFPSPAEDHADASLDIAAHLVRHQAATFFVHARGDSMKGAGILDGDLLVVDRALEPRDGSIVIACVAGEFTVKRYRRNAAGAWLEAANPSYPRIEVAEDDAIWGVVAHAIHSF